MKAMILAAGLGTRLKPFTDHHPKALARVKGKTLLERNIHYLRSYGIGDIIINVHHFAEQVIEQIRLWDDDRLFISDESDVVLETGGGLKKAAPFFDDGAAFVLMNADILTKMDLGRMIVFHKSRRPLATLAVTNRESSRYFLFDEQDRLSGWRNAKTMEEKISRIAEPLFPKAFSGIHIIEPEMFGLMKQEGKFSMVDVYLGLAKDHTVIGYDHSGEMLMDVGRPESLAEAAKYFQ